MKTFFTVILIAFALIVAKGQEVSTNGEIYDYEVGDIFHFFDWSGDQYSAVNAIKNIEIIGKYYSSENDTVFYVRDIASQFASFPDPIWSFAFYIDTVFYYNLNDTLQFIDSVFTDTSLYNNRRINHSDLSMPEEIFTYKRYTDGCGLTNEYFENLMSSGEGENKLVYFNKSGEEWGVPLMVGMSESSFEDKELTLFPNPATTFITLTAPGDVSVEEAIIYNNLGQKVLTVTPVNNTVDVSGLKAGMYMIEVRAKEFTGTQKLIKQ